MQQGCVHDALDLAVGKSLTKLDRELGGRLFDAGAAVESLDGFPESSQHLFRGIIHAVDHSPTARRGFMLGRCSDRALEHDVIMIAPRNQASPDKMHSWLDTALARFDEDNDALIGGTRALLERIVADAGLHARLLNTLSMLEHLGSHKIMATQHSPAIDQPTLRHVAEEAHHAYFMKRQAEKAAGRPLEYVDSDLLAPAAARMYFQRLEAEMKRTLESQKSLRAAYLYMSMIVEFRALWFYGLYQHVLKRVGYGLSLKRIVGEEENHLLDVANRLDVEGELSDARASRFLSVEKRLYERLLRGLELAAA